MPGNLGCLAFFLIAPVCNGEICISLNQICVMKSVYKIGGMPKAPYIKMLSEGMRTGDLVVLAADTSLNTTNINLVGLAQTGIEYLPVS